SQRQAARVLDVPRSTLQAWRAYPDRLDACPEGVAFFFSVSGLAFLHRLVIAFHVVCVGVCACGIPPVWLFFGLSGLHRFFVGASYGTQQQVNRRVEEAIVAYRHDEHARLAHAMPPKDITLTQDEGFVANFAQEVMQGQLPLSMEPMVLVSYTPYSHISLLQT